MRAFTLCAIVCASFVPSLAEARPRSHARKKVKPPPPPPPADQLAPVVTPSLEEAIRLYGGGHFSAAISMLDKLTALPPAAKQQAKLYLAMSFLAIDDAVRAQDVLLELLEADPTFVPPTHSPPALIAFFGKVKAAHQPPLLIEHVAPAAVAPGVQLDVRLRNMRAGYQGKLLYRLQGAGFFSSAPLTPVVSERYAAKPSFDSGARLEYFFLVTTPADKTVQQLRTPESPFSVPITLPVAEPVPAYRKWWFWTLITSAVLVAAGGVTAVIILTRPEPANGNARVTLQF